MSREAHIKAEEALRKAQAAQKENEKAAIDRGRNQEEIKRLQHTKKLVCAVTSACFDVVTVQQRNTLTELSQVFARCKQKAE